MKRTLTMGSGRVLLLSLILAFFGTAARAGFVEVDTAFGPQTGLEDLSTGFVWLHTNITANQSYNQVIADLSGGGIYTGWQYATPSQLAAMFGDYTGGAPTTNTLATNFMNALGGPIFTVSNQGFSRSDMMGLLDVPFDLGHAIYGYIAIDNVFGPSIDPGLQGSQLDSFGTSSIASWLVLVPEPGSLSLCGLAGVCFGVLKLNRRRTRGNRPG